MNSLINGPIARLLKQLQCDAEVADRDVMSMLKAANETPGMTLGQFAAEAIANERADYRRIYTAISRNRNRLMKVVAMNSP